MTLTTKEVAEDLKTSTLTVYKLVRTGKLKAFRVGHRYRFNESDLVKFKQEGMDEQTAQHIQQ